MSGVVVISSSNARPELALPPRWYTEERSLGASTKYPRAYEDDRPTRRVANVRNVANRRFLNVPFQGCGLTSTRWYSSIVTGTGLYEWAQLYETSIPAIRRMTGCARFLVGPEVGRVVIDDAFDLAAIDAEVACYGALAAPCARPVPSARPLARRIVHGSLGPSGRQAVAGQGRRCGVPGGVTPLVRHAAPPAPLVNSVKPG